MNTLDKQYQDLLQDILDNGTKKGDRTGTGTISVFGRQIRHNMKDGFPLLTTKKMPFKTIVTELIWFLKGDTNIKFLVDNGCNIWNGDAYKNYIFNSEWTPISTSNGVIIGKKLDSDETMTQEIFIDKIKNKEGFAEKWGDLGPIYGKQWRKWDLYDQLRMSDEKGNKYFGKKQPIDQIANLVKDLKENPDSRRLMVNAWNVGEIDDMVLPPCHYGFQLYTRELSFDERWEIAETRGFVTGWDKPTPTETYNNINCRLETNALWDDPEMKFNLPKRAISLIWNQRSVDTFLGLPFNIASYGLLLEILGKEVNMVPDQLIGNLGDTHLYSNHLEQAKEQIERESFDLPSVNINDSCKFGSSLPIFVDKLKLEMFELVDYLSQGVIKAPLSN